MEVSDKYKKESRVEEIRDKVKQEKVRREAQERLRNR
jgi:hypothetical protein